MELKELTGFLLVNKPDGLTSFNCVKRVRDVIGHKIKIGHAGTLDAFATGLLIVAVGRAATRHLEQFMELDKWYTATAKLGQLTDTLDYTGEQLVDEDVVSVTREQLERSIKKLGTEYKQIPPIYSALKHEGKALSDLARKEKLSEQELQKIAEEKARTISLFSCELVSFESPFFTVRSHVSHGTYIRVLMNDIARGASSCATTHDLIRSKIGPFFLEDAKSLKYFKSVYEIESSLIPIETMLDKIVDWHY